MIYFLEFTKSRMIYFLEFTKSRMFYFLEFTHESYEVYRTSCIRLSHSNIMSLEGLNELLFNLRRFVKTRNQVCKNPKRGL